jgi:urease accessory protein
VLRAAQVKPAGSWPTTETLARLAWHLGNRHTDLEIAGEQLRLRRDHVLAEIFARLGWVRPWR